MRQFYLLRLLMKSTIVISLVLFIIMIIQSTTITTSPPEESHESYERRIERDVEEIRKRNQDISPTDLESEVEQVQVTRRSEVEEEERQRLWAYLVKQYWEAKKNLTNSIPVIPSNLTDLFIQDPGYNLWGSKVFGESGEFSTEFVDMDRIVPQLLLALEAGSHPAFQNVKKKKIQLYDSFAWWRYSGDFAKDCPGLASKCVFVNRGGDADGVIAARDAFHTSNIAVPESVKRFLFILESPYASSAVLKANDLLTSYWRESDIVTPYQKWVYYDPSVRSKEQDVNYALGKTKMAAVFVSNCGSVNPRLKYIKELQKLVQVDIFGRCGTKSCPRGDESTCFKLLQKEYAFYLSFENANCRDYITEKFFVNALHNNVIPVVLGGHPNDYLAVAPQNSYLHIEDYTSVEELASSMKRIMSDEKEYAKYFAWKGTGDFINAMYLCRVCAMLHYADLVPPPTRTPGFTWRGANSKLCMKKGGLYWRDASV